MQGTELLCSTQALRETYSYLFLVKLTTVMFRNLQLPASLPSRIAGPGFGCECTLHFASAQPRTVQAPVVWRPRTPVGHVRIEVANPLAPSTPLKALLCACTVSVHCFGFACHRKEDRGGVPCIDGMFASVWAVSMEKEGAET